MGLGQGGGMGQHQMGQQHQGGSMGQQHQGGSMGHPLGQHQGGISMGQQHQGDRNEEHDLIARYANRLARFQSLLKL